MYIPSYFREDNQEVLLAFMRAHSFATVVSNVDGTPFATHIPVGIEERDGTVFLTGHISKANEHARAFSYASDANGETPDGGSGRSLVIFAGPHAYVSPTAYEAHESVPTWNYIAVHAVGRIRAIRFADTLQTMETMLDSMIEQYDPTYQQQWRSLPDKFRDGMMRGVIGFEMRVDSLQGKYKLSQNRSAHDQASVQAMLQASGDASAREVARVMQDRAP
ncbi:MAG: FMN-binding negative transcriptional regulator [Gemmatimonas sp.]